MTGYRSPFPKRLHDPNTRFTHEKYRRESYVVHVFPRPDGREDICDPRFCRECNREREWKEGQTHGNPHEPAED